MGIDTYLRLFGPDGALLDQNDDGGAVFLGSRIRHILPASSTYSVRLNGFAGDQGDYAIEFLRVAASSRGAVASGQAVGGALAAGEVHLWTFQGVSGQDIQIDASGFDTNLRLYAPDGRLVAANDDGLPDFGSRISTRLFAAGLYSIEVTGVFGDSGTYTLLPTAGTTEYRDRGALPAAGGRRRGERHHRRRRTRGLVLPRP